MPVLTDKTCICSLSLFVLKRGTRGYEHELMLGCMLEHVTEAAKL